MDIAGMFFLIVGLSYVLAVIIVDIYNYIKTNIKQNHINGEYQRKYLTKLSKRKYK